MVGLSVNKAWRWAAIPIKATWPKLGTPEVPMNMYKPRTAMRFINRPIKIDWADSEKKKWAARVSNQNWYHQQNDPFQ